MRFLKKKLSYFNPLDINLSIGLKYVSDWGMMLKKLSPLSSPLFIALNRNIILRSKKAIVTLLLFMPFLFLNPSMDTVRFLFSICIFWIFLEKFNTPYKYFSLAVTCLIALYAFIIFAGIFFPENYLVMGGGDLRYKFFLESHNALCIPVLISFIYLVNALVQDLEQRGPVWMRPVIFIAIILLCIVFLFIKSRLYLGISFLMILLVALQNIRKTKLLLAIPVIYGVLFLGLTLLKKDLATERVIIHGQHRGAYRIMDNTRMWNLSATGRWGMVQAFGKTVAERPWHQFIYQNNTQPYLAYKSMLPNMDLSASTLTENAYMIVFLNTGAAGLCIFLYIFGFFAVHFLKRKEYLSLIYFLLLMGVWLFEETVLFPFSLFCQLLALATVNRFERKKQESSTQ
jgi:hypothetical protein